MKLFEIKKFTALPVVGKAYRLKKDPKLGDYSDLEVYVETGPRGEGSSQQFRVSTGPGNMDVDWIDTSMFEGSIELSNIPDFLIYKKK